MLYIAELWNFFMTKFQLKLLKISSYNFFLPAAVIFTVIHPTSNSADWCFNMVSNFEIGDISTSKKGTLCVSCTTIFVLYCCAVLNSNISVQLTLKSLWYCFGFLVVGDNIQRILAEQVLLSTLSNFLRCDNFGVAHNY